MQASRPPETGDITGFSGSETIPLFPVALSATANKRRNGGKVKEVMDVKEVREVREVREVQEAKVIACSSFLLTCLARIAVYSAAATETNP
jgi:hypothetical protein